MFRINPDLQDVLRGFEAKEILHLCLDWAQLGVKDFIKNTQYILEFLVDSLTGRWIGTCDLSDSPTSIQIYADGISDALNISKTRLIMVLIFSMSIFLGGFVVFSRCCGGRSKQVGESDHLGKTLEKTMESSSSSEIFSTRINDETWMKQRIGRLIVSRTKIDTGGKDVYIYEGIYDGRPAAVKSVARNYYDVTIMEVQDLIANQHPNIIRTYGMEWDREYSYVSMERWTCNLDDLIQLYSDSYQDGNSPNVSDSLGHKVRMDTLKVTMQDVNLWKANSQPSSKLLKLMRGEVSGLVHLHELGIVYGDLKPRDVLIVKERSLRAKLHHMSKIKRRPCCVSKSGDDFTTGLFQAPEQLLNGPVTQAADMFNLGCVLFFCITRGKHPFGDGRKRSVNIMKNKVNLSSVAFVPEAFDLLSRLLQPKPESRPKALEVLHHPLFWNPVKRLSFIDDTNDRLEQEMRLSHSNILEALEAIASVVLGRKWNEKLEPELLSYICRCQCYNYSKVRDLLKAIGYILKRDKVRQLPQEIKELLLRDGEGFNDYFAHRFPRLFIEVYRVIYIYCKKEQCFHKYFKDDRMTVR